MLAITTARVARGLTARARALLLENKKVFVYLLGVSKGMGLRVNRKHYKKR